MFCKLQIKCLFSPGQYRELMSRREVRRARRADMARRRTAAAAERMRVISHLAAAGDDFGTKDSDWDAYKRYFMFLLHTKIMKNSCGV